MKLNKKAQTNMILKIMIGIIGFIIVMIMIQPTNEAITDNTAANITTSWNCSSSTMSSANQAACIVTDYALFYLVGLGIAISVAYVAGKKQISGVITAIVSFVVVAVIINPLKDLIIIARDASHLSCGTASITTAAKLSCLVVDLWLFWFILTILSTAVTYIAVKKVVLSE